MYCATCQKLSFHIICKNCLQNLWFVDSKRELNNGLKVFSSFALSELHSLVLSKNNAIGSRVLGRLGCFGVAKFFESNNELLLNNESVKKSCCVLCVRNKRIGAYSHSAILAKCFKKYGFKVKYSALIAQNEVRFSTLSKAERLQEKRNFTLKINKKYNFIIIVDDIITTGQTLLEASETIKKDSKIPLFAWTLCDARF